MFTLTKEQWEKVKEWQLQQPPCPVTAIGGRWTYSFTATSLGLVITVTDGFTKESLDVSDYEDW